VCLPVELITAVYIIPELMPRYSVGLKRREEKQNRGAISFLECERRGMTDTNLR